MKSFDRRTNSVLVGTLLILCAILYGLVVPSDKKNNSSTQSGAGKIINRSNNSLIVLKDHNASQIAPKTQEEKAFVPVSLVRKKPAIKQHGSRNVASEPIVGNTEREKKIVPVASIEEEKNSEVGTPRDNLKENEDPIVDNQKAWLTLGIGVNYLKYSQTVASLSDLEFQSLESPTVFAEAGSMVSEKWGMNMSYKSSPGSVKSSASITMLNEKYNWKTIAVEVLHQSDALQLRSGLQQHFVPFMTADSSGDVQIREHNLTMMTSGFNYFFGYGKRIRHIFGLRYQYPIAQGSGGSEAFAIKPKFAFDGQVGQEFFLTKKLFIGFYWYGQWHDYDFVFQNGTRTDSGHQSLFFSTIDARLGFEF